MFFRNHRLFFRKGCPLHSPGSSAMPQRRLPPSCAIRSRARALYPQPQPGMARQQGWSVAQVVFGCVPSSPCCLCVECVSLWMHAAQRCLQSHGTWYHQLTLSWYQQCTLSFFASTSDHAPSVADCMCLEQQPQLELRLPLHVCTPSVTR